MSLSLLDAENCTDTQLWYDKKCTDMDVFCKEFDYGIPINNTYCTDPTNDTIIVPVQNISFRCGIFGFCLLSFSQNERKIYKRRQLSLSQFVYFLREVCLLFNF